MKENRRARLYYFAELNNLTEISVYSHFFGDCDLHRHDFFEFEYIVEGEVLSFLNGQEQLVRTGDVVYVTPADVHSYKACGEEFVKTITVHFNTENLGGQFRISVQKARILHCSRELQEAFFTLQRESETRDVFSEFAVRNALERLIMLFLRSTSFVTQAENTDKISLALNYINKNFNRSVDLETVCDLCGYSPSYFCRQFKNTTGYTFLGYLTKMRLTCAEHMLLTTGDSVLQICFDSGFGSVRNFNREFKKKHGITPQQYREQKSKIRP